MKTDIYQYKEINKSKKVNQKNHLFKVKMIKILMKETNLLGLILNEL